MSQVRWPLLCGPAGLRSKETIMTLKTVPLSALCPAKGNPRRHIDKGAIAGLAESIKNDGVLQNLVVEKCDDGKFRVVRAACSP